MLVEIDNGRAIALPLLSRYYTGPGFPAHLLHIGGCDRFSDTAEGTWWRTRVVSGDVVHQVRP